MKAMIGFMALATTILPRLSCLGPQGTTIQLINNTQFPVEATIFFSDQQDTPESVLDDVGDEITFTIPAGQTQPFTRDCEQLQAFKIHGDLQLIGDIGPSDSTGVFRDTDEFNCGDTIQFTFTASNPPIDLNISPR